jgi:predicted  nucleic acid-binding Zn-ribbon protein
MAKDTDSNMARLDQLEASVAHISEILVLQNERIEIGFGNLREEMLGSRQEMTGMRQEMTGMRQEMTGMRQEVTGIRQEVREGFAAMRGESQSLRDEMRSARDETRLMREALTDRLDRLISIGLRERTAGIERLAGIEERLTRLEAHVGLPP